jgi:transcriptional regulator with XRE-family HTH domain
MADGRRPTQREIAAELGLSTATVSLALRDNPMIASKNYWMSVGNNAKRFSMIVC